MARPDPERAGAPPAAGYRLELQERDGRVDVSVLAGPGSCHDLMRVIIGGALGVEADMIDLRYPGDAEPDPGRPS
ncbi:MAG TPA: hypothetical protein VMI33_05535 [Streptosporangiaceae bacterium]|nr:hypothetical protein [Streptosporangiaceae bacterium]